jgi:beta-glucanase (GH16 family)
VLSDSVTSGHMAPRPARSLDPVASIDLVITPANARLAALLGVLLAVLAVALILVGGIGADGAPSSRTAAVPAPLHLVWAENFNGRRGSKPNPAHWNFDTGGTGWGDEELETHTSRATNAALDGHGHLVITARAEKFTGPEGITRRYTSARLQTLHKFHFEYGLVQARIKIPAGAGLLPQFWMLGTNAYHLDAWPACGEIDTMEVLGSEPDVLRGTLHGPWPWALHGVGASVRTRASLADAFHVYAVKWEPERIQFLLDGTVYATLTPADLRPGAAWPFQHRFFLLLDLAVGGTTARAPGLSTRFPAPMLVDWIRVWQWPAAPGA